MTKEQRKRVDFVRNTIGVVGAKFILIFIRLAVSAITSRFLGPAGRGLYYAAIQISGTASSLGTLSMGESVIYMVGQKSISPKKVMGTVFALVLLCTAVVLSVLFLVCPLLSNNVLKHLSTPFMMCVYIAVPLHLAEYFCLMALRGLKKFKAYSSLSVLSMATLLLAILLAVVFYETEAIVVLRAYVVAKIVTVGAMLATLYFYSEKRLSVAWRSILPVMRYGSAIHVGAMLNKAEYRVDVFLLLFFLSPAEVGIYSIGVALAQMLWYVTLAVNNVLFPEISSREKDDGRLIRKSLKFILAANAVLAVALVIGGHFFVLALYGRPFLQAYTVFLVLLPGVFADIISKTIASWLKGTGRPVFLSYVSAGSLAANIALNCIMIPYWGIHGAAFASAISYSLRAIILLLAFCHKTKSSLYRIFVIQKQEIREITKIVKDILPKRDLVT
jgi:O-antigen/teichoic acid export membrane protein